jgi:tRNA 2-selenouridine synthase
VLDLEDLAAHRGRCSAICQTAAAVAEVVREPAPARALGARCGATGIRRRRVEKIGQLQVPEALIGAMRASPCVVLDTTIEVRVSLLLEEYRHFVDNPEALDAQLDCLVGLHGRETIAGWKSLASRGAWRDFVALLLMEHYDPAYRRSSRHNFVHLPQATRVAIDSAEAAAFDAAARALIEETVAA